MQVSNVSSIFLLLLMVLFQLTASAAVGKRQSPFDSAMAAYEKQDYVTALMQWFPLAEADDKEAQFMLGRVYLEQASPGRDVEKAIYWLQRAANLGHHEAQTTLGMLYLQGEVIERNPQQAATYLLLATRNEQAQQRSAESFQQELEQNRASEVADFSKGMAAYNQQDYATALMLWMPLTSSGNADAMFMLGKMYMEQPGERRNPRKAEYWYKRAAELGHVEAQMALGLMYYTGKDIPKNLSLAARWLLRASENRQTPAAVSGRPASKSAKKSTREQSPFNKGMIAYQNKDYLAALMYWHPLALAGNADAQLMMGNLYLREEGIYKDERLGLAWYERAIAQNDVKTTKTLGLMYLYGDDIKKDAGLAIELLLKAARQGDAESQFTLGNIYLKGKVTQQNLPKAGYWYQQAANAKHTEAQFALAEMYRQGLGVPRDINQAISLYNKADKNNHAASTVALAEIYFTGQDKPKDLKKAFALYEKAAGLGSAHAQSRLGDLYMSGEGVEQNQKKALAWYQKSAAQGDLDGLHNLGKMYVNGYGGISVDYKKGVELFMQAAKQGHGLAQLDLGAAYYNGKGVVFDSAMAYAWFHLASMKGIDAAYRYKSAVYKDMLPEDRKRADQLVSEYSDLYK